MYLHLLGAGGFSKLESLLFQIGSGFFHLLMMSKDEAKGSEREVGGEKFEHSQHVPFTLLLALLHQMIAKFHC